MSLMGRMRSHARYYFTPNCTRAQWVCALGYWPERSLLAKGWTPDRLAYQRDATPEEELEIRAATRCISYLYATLDYCLECEAEIVDGEELERLTKALRDFEAAHP
jgi:hypothetical protein